MADGGTSIFERLKGYNALEELIAEGEAESLYLECKAPSDPRLTKDQKAQLAVAISGFSNTGGGVIAYGLSTTRHAHTGLDVISQIEPIGQATKLEQQIHTTIPVATTPRVLSFKTKILRRKAKDSRGVVLLYVPPTSTDPVQANHDNVFYIRTGDEFRPAPYEIIKRLFSAVDSPDLEINFDSRIVKLNKDGSWRLPFAITNKSPAIAEHVTLSVSIENPEAVQSIRARGLQDASAENPGEIIYMASPESVIHRGLDVVAGTLDVKMKVKSRTMRRLDLEIIVYANKMRAKRMTCQLSLAKSGFSVKNVDYSNLY